MGMEATHYHLAPETYSQTTIAVLCSMLYGPVFHFAGWAVLLYARCVHS